MNLVGQRLGKYQIESEIGRGGMGAVYKGYDPVLDRYLAIKILAEHLVWEKEFVERFLREARAAARLRHPNIVTIHDVGEEAGHYYFVMEYVDGEDLKAILSRRGTLPVEEVVPILKQLAAGLDHAHTLGITHRDVKPANVIVRKDGHVLLTDFGIAKAAYESKMTATGTALGTPEYMAPEQALGRDVGPQTDQYAMGVVAYEMLAGRPPFLADSTTAVLYMQAHEPLPPIRGLRPDLPLEVEAVLSRALAKSPAERFPSCAAFAEALEGALHTGALREPAATPLPPAAPPAPGPWVTPPAVPAAGPMPAVTPPTPVPAPPAVPAGYPAAPVTPSPQPAIPTAQPPGFAPGYPVPPFTPPPRPAAPAVVPYARTTPPARRKGLPAWAWVLLALGGLGVLACAVVLVVLVAQTTQESLATAATQTAEAAVQHTAAAQKETLRAGTAAVEARSTQTAAVQAEATALAKALHEALLLTAAQWPLIFSEPFETNQQGWDVGEYSGERATGYRSFNGTTYYWYAEATQGVVWRSIPDDLPVVSDFYVTVEGRQISGAPTCWYGLVLREDGTSYYYFEIADAGKFRFSRYSGDWATLIGSTDSGAISPGQINRLTVIAQSDRFVLYINDQYVGEAYDSELTSGTAGFAIEMDEGETAEFEFDNLEVRAP